jgi:channel protein (hemolysin III family)
MPLHKPDGYHVWRLAKPPGGIPIRIQWIHVLLTIVFVLILVQVGVAALPELHHLPGFYEPFSAISHLVGVILFVVLGVILLRRGQRYCRKRGQPAGGRMLALGLYAFASVLLMSTSMVFHMLERDGIPSRVMERIDHSAIFILIAGTLTPIQVLLFRGPSRWGPLTFVWITTITAITLKVVFFESLPTWLGLTFYLSLGWFGGFSGYVLARRHNFYYVRSLAVGGIFYTLGAIMHQLDQLILIQGVIHAHEVFHVAVLAGAFWQWKFIWNIAGHHQEMGNANESADEKIDG